MLNKITHDFQEFFGMIHHLQLGVSKEEAERVENLPYNWQKLKAQCSDVQELLQEIHPHFHQKLLQDIEQFQNDCEDFYKDYEMVNVIVPQILMSVK